MATTELMTAFRVAESIFHLDQGQELSGEASGIIRVKDLRPALWRATFRSTTMRNADASELEAEFDALDGSIGTFLAWNPRVQYPRSDPGGMIVTGSAVKVASLNVDNERLALKDLPAGYVLSEGDFIAFDYGSGPSRAFHRLLAGAIANGGGVTPEFKVRPHVRTGATVNAAVTLIRPAAEMMVLPGSFALSPDGPFRSMISFSAVQVLR